MTAKEHLLQVKRADAVIANRQSELENLRELSTSISCSNEGEKVQKTLDTDKISSLIAKIVDIQHEINDSIDDYIDLKHKIASEINGLGVGDHTKVLFKRYIEYKSWELIAVEMNFSIRHIYNLHGTALLEFQKKYCS